MTQEIRPEARSTLTSKSSASVVKLSEKTVPLKLLANENRQTEKKTMCFFHGDQLSGSLGSVEGRGTNIEALFFSKSCT